MPSSTIQYAAPAMKNLQHQQLNDSSHSGIAGLNAYPGNPGGNQTVGHSFYGPQQHYLPATTRAMTMKRSRFDIPPEESFGSRRYQDLGTTNKRQCGGRGTNTTEPASHQTTLWIGDLEYWEDENYLYYILQQFLPETCTVSSIKIVRDSPSQLGYGFVDFSTHEEAKIALQLCSRTQRPGHSRPFRVTWAATNTHKGYRPSSNTLGGGRLASTVPSTLQMQASRCSAAGALGMGVTGGTSGVSAAHPPLASGDHNLTLYVGPLDKSVTTAELAREIFALGYRSVISVKIACDSYGVSRGFGFIRFGDQSERDDALTRLCHIQLGHRPLQVTIAHRNSTLDTKSFHPMELIFQQPQQTGLSALTPTTTFATEALSGSLTFPGGSAMHQHGGVPANAAAMFSQVPLMDATSFPMYTSYPPPYMFKADTSITVPATSSAPPATSSAPPATSLAPPTTSSAPSTTSSAPPTASLASPTTSLTPSAATATTLKVVSPPPQPQSDHEGLPPPRQQQQQQSNDGAISSSAPWSTSSPLSSTLDETTRRFSALNEDRSNLTCNQ